MHLHGNRIQAISHTQTVQGQSRSRRIGVDYTDEFPNRGNQSRKFFSHHLYEFKNDMKGTTFGKVPLSSQLIPGKKQNWSTTPYPRIQAYRMRFKKGQLGVHGLLKYINIIQDLWQTVIIHGGLTCHKDYVKDEAMQGYN